MKKMVIFLFMSVNLWACSLCQSEKEITEIVVVLDRSGSMESIKNDMIGGLKQFIIEQKQVKGKANFTLVQFDTKYEIIYEGVNIQDVNEINIVPRGGTALLDALGETIEKIIKRLINKPDRKVIFVVITDGLENSSTRFTKSVIVKNINHMSKKHKWKFIYLGANQDAIQEGSSLGINSINCSTFDSFNVSGALNTMSLNVTSFRSETE